MNQFLIYDAPVVFPFNTSFIISLIPFFKIKLPLKMKDKRYNDLK